MTLVIGVGASSRSDAREIGALIAAVLDRDDLRGEDVACVATAAARAGTGHVRDAAEMLGFHLVTYPVGVLAEVAVPNPAEGVRARTGTASVAEAAALHGARALGRRLRVLGGGARLVVPKRTAARATAAVARITGEPGEAGS
ncbi:cobalamin biosynthesis protein [Actinomadura verrucosospora]|uniref:Precorrin-3B C17-methyltransferase n=1 Tax=Actinomadura verrucosospora TaxID=46165 RepID=A0A7D3ZJM7_ACTVE|nr:cobalamin biosynthesis protein [Actinomadura verrucosospora]QKG21501.1 precorrin-3B C17-methyltransferase [Actinomadura verrucosospora]